MGADHTLELRRWADAVESLIERAPLKLVRRVMVFSETGSTQDAAESSGGGEPGLLVLAGSQSAGRGRLGRAWDSGAGMGVAATFTLSVPHERHATLSLAAGLAAAEAAERALAGGASRAGALGLRWPNDVVERSTGRKLAGVLVESKGESRDGSPLLLVGIGINVLQREDDFPPEIRGAATSLHLMGGAPSRLDVILALAERFDGAASAALAEDAARQDLLERWKRRDVLTGRPAAFVHDGRTYEGIVREIKPDLSLVLRTGDGPTVTLPCATTSLLHADERGGRRAAARRG